MPMQIRASHILVGSKEEAEQIREDINNGVNFVDLAKTKSKCPSGAKGGDLGVFSPGQMVKPFDHVAFRLEVGQLSEPVETQFGWHIILRTE